jgi:hypothetical protein
MTGSSTRAWLRAALVIGAAGMVLRFLAARGDMWIDEIWSIGMARAGGSAWTILAGMPSDNNHHLNTLFQLVVGPNASPLLHRGLALAAGAGLLLLAATSAFVGDRPGRLVALALLAFSPYAVQYTSEARGYGPAMALCMACACLWDSYRRAPRATVAAAFAASGALAALAHATAAFPLAGLALWGALELPGRLGRWRAAGVLLRLFALPFAAVAFVYAFHLRHLVVGGGEGFTLLEALRQFLEGVLGFPRGPAEVFTVIAIAAAGAELAGMARRDRGRAAFFAVALLAEPAWILVTRPGLVYPRYFVVSIPFLLVLLAGALRRAAAWRPVGAAAVAAFLLAFAAGSAARLHLLLRDGRGRYREALAWVLDHSGSDVVSIGSDHEIPTFEVIRYYARESGTRRPIALVPDRAWSDAGPEWVVVEGAGGEPEFLARTGARYVLSAVFRSCPNAGLDWSLYRMTRPGRPRGDY